MSSVKRSDLDLYRSQPFFLTIFASYQLCTIFFQGVFDPHKYTNADMCKIHAITYEALMEDEESQVRGFVHFADGAGVSFPHLTLFTPKEAVRIVKNGEVNIRF